jgi:hypothetical protein
MELIEGEEDGAPRAAKLAGEEARGGKTRARHEPPGEDGCPELPVELTVQRQGGARIEREVGQEIMRGSGHAVSKTGPFNLLNLALSSEPLFTHPVPNRRSHPMPDTAPLPQPKAPSARTRVKRLPARGHYDRATIAAILDAGLVCHVGYVIDGQPYVTPTAYWREGDRVYWHGSSASRKRWQV